jgi:GT2 family glycosyltransferase
VSIIDNWFGALTINTPERLTTMTNDPDVTIVVVPREQFSKSQISLESIYAATPQPFRLIYVDGNSPPSLRRYLEQQAAVLGFKLLRTEKYLTSNEARNLGLREVRTKYVVFLDNDVFVHPGWLEALLQCADETDAWVVGPLYCYGSDGSDGEPYIVHTAGASLRIIDNGTRRLEEKHRHVNRRVVEVRRELCREPIDLVEFHCMLVRTHIFNRTGLLDEKLFSFLDHVDFCLAVRQAGGTVYFEPDAVVTHLAPPPFAWIDLPYFLLRWSNAWLRPSVCHFARKHEVREGDLDNHFWFRDQHRRRLIAGVRRRIQRFLGNRGLSAANFVDRIIFNVIIEHTIVRQMQRKRVVSQCTKDQGRALTPLAKKASMMGASGRRMRREG